MDEKQVAGKLVAVPVNKLTSVKIDQIGVSLHSDSVGPKLTVFDYLGKHWHPVVNLFINILEKYGTTKL